MLDDLPFSLIVVFNLVVPSAPLYIAWLVGLVMAVRRWRRHPRISKYLCIGTGIFFGTAVVMGYVQMMLPRILFNQLNMSSTELSFIFMGLGILRSLLGAGAWVFVLMAVFSDRTPSFRFLPQDEPPDLGQEKYTGPGIQEDRPRS
jgi:hypothetical protein